MAVAGECCVHESVNHIRYRYGVIHPAAERYEVDVIMGLGHFRGKQVVHQSTPDASDFIGCQRHADSRAAKQNPEIIAAVIEFPARLQRDVRIVCGIFIINAHISGLAVFSLQKRDNLIFQNNCSMVSGDYYSLHLRLLMHGYLFLFNSYFYENGE
jgi:hypothetical protein